MKKLRRKSIDDYTFDEPTNMTSYKIIQNKKEFNNL